MNVVKCAVCGAKMRRNGKTKAGKTRWRCESCGSSLVVHVDNAAKRLEEFLDWLLSKKRQVDMPGGGRTFRRRTAEFWRIWPLPPVTGEICRVVFVDGIYLERNVCVLVARSEDYVLGWYVSRSENSRAYKALMARIAPPEVVVTDGGSGFQKARREIWPDTRVQRCTFHAFEQVKRYTTARPRTQAGVDLYALAKRLFEVRTSEQATAWTASYAGWCASYDEFLREETVDDEGHAVLTHERLVKARNSLTCLVRQNAPFTYADPASWQGSGPCPPPTTLLKAQTPSSVTCSGSTAGFRSNAALRQFTGGVTCIRSARCPPPGS